MSIQGNGAWPTLAPGRQRQANAAASVQAVLEACDCTGSVTVVLWNSVCVQWYRCLKPGDIVSLRGVRVKRCYYAEPEDIGTTPGRARTRANSANAARGDRKPLRPLLFLQRSA